MNKDSQESSVYISAVAPAFNERENLPRLVEEVAAALSPLGQKWEFIVVDDHSEDDSLEVLAALKASYPQVRVIALRRRSGQSAALDAGLRQARGVFIATLDADCQNDPASIPELLKFVLDDRADFVNGWRARRNDPWLRLVSTRVANGVRNWLTRESIHDSACGLKLFRRECVREIKFFNGMHRFLPTLVKLEGYRVLEAPVNHRPREAGKAKYGLWNRVFRALRDTFAVRWMQSRHVKFEIDRDRSDL